MIGDSMDNHIKKFFSDSFDETSRGNFSKVISLNESPDIPWEEVVSKMPELCKGWYELAQISPKDRIELVRDYWLSQMPFHPRLPQSITQFFDNVDDIGVYIVQKRGEENFTSCLVYGLIGGSGFFWGNLGAEEKSLHSIKSYFPDEVLPADYEAFLKIHDGFSKSTDTGIIPTKCFRETNERFQKILLKEETLKTTSGIAVDPLSLIPFYESFGMPFFQCFWSDWYPEIDMGNVYYSGALHSITEYDENIPSEETMAFPTFGDWLSFYLEQIK